MFYVVRVVAQLAVLIVAMVVGYSGNLWGFFGLFVLAAAMDERVTRA